MRWVVSQQAYAGLSANQTPETAAALLAAGVPQVTKVWTELAFEEVRKELSPDAPSRLNCLFAFADPLEALSFTETTGQGQQVWCGEVDTDVSWKLVDMSPFNVVEPDQISAAGFREAWDKAQAQASRYWNPGAQVDVAEILVAGSLTLLERVRLMPFLREAGLLASTVSAES
jgi:hypothetical protein